MEKEKVLNELFEDLKRCKSIAFKLKRSNGKKYFPKWGQEREKFLFKEFSGQELRSVLPHEIIMEFDFIKDFVDKDKILMAKKEALYYINKVKKNLISKNIKFYITSHKGKSPHLRLKVEALENEDDKTRIAFKKDFCKQILQEINFDSELVILDYSLINTANKIIPFEEQPHFKPKYKGNKEAIIFINNVKSTLKFDKKKFNPKKDLSRKLRNNTILNLERIVKKELFSFFDEHYSEGNRNHLIMALSGIMVRNGFIQSEAETILEEVLEHINSIDEFEERLYQLKQAFNKDKGEVAVKHWFEIIFADEDENYIEEQYRIFKHIFYQAKDNEVKVSTGFFKILEEDLEFHDIDYVCNSSIKLKKVGNLGTFGKFLVKESINFEEDKKEIFKQITNITKDTKVKKDNKKEFSEEDFFKDNDLHEDNQLIYKNDLAFTFCDYDYKVLVTKEGIKDITKDESFLVKPFMESMKLSNYGYLKLKDKKYEKNIFEKVKKQITRFICFEDEIELNLVTLWVFHTYLFKLQGNTVYLHITGAPGGGKSTLQKTLNRLCWNSEYICDITESSLFRMVDCLQNTLNIDEIDKWSQEKLSGIQGVLNNGYSKGGVTARTESNPDGGFYVAKFRVFSPKTITTNNPRLLDSFKTRCYDLILQTTFKKLKNIDTLTKNEEDYFLHLRDDIILYMLNEGKSIFDKYLDLIKDENKVSNRTNQLISVLECFNLHFNLNLDLNMLFEKNKDEMDLMFNYQYQILRFLNGIEVIEGIIEVSNKDILEFLKRHSSSNLLSEHYPTIGKIGIEMKKLGFKDFKSQLSRDKIKRNCYLIPFELVKKRTLARGFNFENKEN